MTENRVLKERYRDAKSRKLTNKNDWLEEPKKKRKSSIADCAQLQQIRLGKGASEKLR